MALLATFEIGEKTKEHHVISQITEKEKEIALRKFNGMKETGALSGNFEDSVWLMNNETNGIMLNFNLNEVLVRKQKVYSYNEFVNILKYYICICFGDKTLLMYPRIITNIKKAINETLGFTKMSGNVEVLQKDGVADFISLLPWVDEELQIEHSIKYKWNRTRVLAEYQSYFLFDDIMKEFWESASEDEKDYYYPLYLWWNITMIIPLRVTEFTVMPKDCLSKKNRKWYLTIRRTAIKGINDVTKRYKIDTDYKKYTYEITDTIARKIQDYQKRTEKYNPAEIDSIFSDSVYIETKRKLLGCRSEDAAYKHMRVTRFNFILGIFYENIVSGRFHKNIITQDVLDNANEEGRQRGLENNEIVYIHLGDTRHIALQNLLINGCNLLMAKEVSGHETIDMIYHYAGNLKNIVKCRAYNLYKLSKKEDSIVISYVSNADIILSDREQKYIEVDSGKCYSRKFVSAGDTTDCYLVGGNCFFCQYHKSNNSESQIKLLEQNFEDKVARVQIWLTSKNQLKDNEEIAVLAEEMSTATRNLEVAYHKELNEGRKIDG